MRVDLKARPHKVSTRQGKHVEASCDKHFVVVSRHQQTPPLTTSDKCHNLPRSGGTVLITLSRSQRWQHAVKPDIGRESRFLPTPRAFDAPHREGGSRRNIATTYCTISNVPVRLRRHNVIHRQLCGTPTDNLLTVPSPRDSRDCKPNPAGFPHCTNANPRYPPTPSPCRPLTHSREQLWLAT